MLIIYKDGKSCTCHRDQLPYMEAAGWSLSEKKPVAAKKAAKKPRTMKADTGNFTGMEPAE